MDVRLALEEHGVRPTPQRVAIANYVLTTEEHPSADGVWGRVRAKLPTLSRATVYNTLTLFETHGLIRSYAITEGATVYDPRVEPHHHLVDTETGEIHDLPWETLAVQGVESLEGFDVRDYQVVLHGKRSKG